MVASNPTLAGNKKPIPRNIRSIDRPALCKILCRDNAPTQNALDNINSNSITAVCEALLLGFTWSDIGEFFGCSEAHLRYRWYAKLPYKDKELIHSSETMYAENLIRKILDMMVDVIDFEHDKPEFKTDMERLKFETAIANLNFRKVITLGRVFDAIFKYLQQVDRQAPKRKQAHQPAPITIIKIAD